MQTIEQIQKRVRAGLRGGATEIVLVAVDAQMLLDELGRLQQSSDRLRRQNRRARLRLQRAGIEADPAGGDRMDGADGADGAYSGDATDGGDRGDDVGGAPT